MIRDQIERMKARYNGDNDIIPGTPTVTWADRENLDLIERLLTRIENLEREVRVMNTLPDSIKEALNSGDGTYRP